ncbi:UNVERIFIED_ORG: phosphoglycerol transferase MdoB-like AlkP superfamily enzyme [Heyndrickxia coagulans]
MVILNHLPILMITAVILIVQKLIVPRLKLRFLIYILPGLILIVGTLSAIFSQNGFWTKIWFIGMVLLLSIITLLMGETDKSER